MRTILLLRHAKSDRDRPELADIERPLAPRGVRAAATVGSLLARLGWPPELVVSSPAERAVATVRIAREAGGWDCPEEHDIRLYEGDAEVVVGVLHELADSMDRVLLCGHEPTWSELASLLTGGGRVRMPTAAVAAIACDVRTWDELAPGCGVLQWLVTPKLLGPAPAGRER